ncbi:unannotated protein [freshwater metagenome]|uniref:Unannotated protein n=1 Tax=freshwater metagenome TaxID=449393 RepID=A0A6J7EDD4_9ZZZZ
MNDEVSLGNPDSPAGRAAGNRSAGHGKFGCHGHRSWSPLPPHPPGHQCGGADQGEDGPRAPPVQPNEHSGCARRISRCVRIRIRVGVPKNRLCWLRIRRASGRGPLVGNALEPTHDLLVEIVTCCSKPWVHERTVETKHHPKPRGARPCGRGPILRNGCGKAGARPSSRSPGEHCASVVRARARRGPARTSSQRRPPNRLHTRRSR